jgi:hypothetical protein
MKETANQATTEITLTDVDPNDFDQVVQFLYTGTTNLEDDKCATMLQLATYFQARSIGDCNLRE